MAVATMPTFRQGAKQEGQFETSVGMCLQAARDIQAHKFASSSSPGGGGNFCRDYKDRAARKADGRCTVLPPIELTAAVPTHRTSERATMLRSMPDMERRWMRVAAIYAIDLDALRRTPAQRYLVNRGELLTVTRVTIPRFWSDTKISTCPPLLQSVKYSSESSNRSTVATTPCTCCSWRLDRAAAFPLRQTVKARQAPAGWVAGNGMPRTRPRRSLHRAAMIKIHARAIARGIRFKIWDCRTNRSNP